MSGYNRVLGTGQPVHPTSPMRQGLPGTSSVCEAHANAGDLLGAERVYEVRGGGWGVRGVPVLVGRPKGDVSQRPPNHRFSGGVAPNKWMHGGFMLGPQIIYIDL